MNAELRKNLWLELSLARLITVPAVLAVLVMMGAISGKVSTGPYLWLTMLFIFWGLFRASSAVADEVRDNTWDMQLLSGASPWTLAVGKIFGATAFQAYGAGLSLFVYLVFSLGSSDVQFLGKRLLLTVLSAALLWTVGVIGSIISASKMKLLRRTKKGGIGVLGVILFFFLTSWIAPLASMSNSFTGQEWSFSWWGIEFTLMNFSLLSLMVFLGWGLLGAYRLMREELQFKSVRWGWAAFLLFLWFYSTPFTNFKFAYSYNHDVSWVLFGLTGFVIGALAIYVTLIAGDLTFIRLRSFFVGLTRGDLRAAGVRLPQIIPGLVIAVVGLIIIAVSAPFSDQQIFFERSQNLKNSLLLPILVTTLVFILRDICVVAAVYINSPQSRRTDLTLFFYFVIAYGLLPTFFAILPGTNLLGLVLPFNSFTTMGHIGWSNLLTALPGFVAALIYLHFSWKKQLAAVLREA